MLKVILQRKMPYIDHQVDCSELVPAAPVKDFAFLIPVLMLLD